jgi:NAD(P)-dependent dehydrogenase (short-subunit alcohol dehydrogenase family)
MRQDGKVTVVTGASTGIGQASARELHEAGVRSGACDVVSTGSGSIAG